MPTALFVQRDAATVLVPRSLRASCSREEWDNPRWRQAQIDKAWAAGVHAIKATGDYTLVTPAPVTLFRGSDGEVLYADIRTNPTAKPKLIWPSGKAVAFLPALRPAVVQRTTYAHFAEGPLIHIELTAPSPGLSADDKRAIDMMPNSALRERMTAAMGPSTGSAEAQTAPDTRERIDFIIRGIFSMPDLTVLVSKQSEQGSKLVLDGTGETSSLFHGPDDLMAAADVFETDAAGNKLP